MMDFAEIKAEAQSTTKVIGKNEMREGRLFSTIAKG